MKKIISLVAGVVLAAATYYVSGAELPFTQNSGVANIDKARQQLASLHIRAEHSVADYERDDWSHWEAVGGGCDAREASLKQHAEELVPGKGCEIPGGRWVSPYDTETVTDPSELDIDHVVPLAEAHASGGHHWSEQQRTQFANDTRFLLPVTAASNRSKGDSDPAEWMPPDNSYHCDYIALYVDAKATYRLSVDPAEHDAIERTLNHC